MKFIVSFVLIAFSIVVNAQSSVQNAYVFGAVDGSYVLGGIDNLGNIYNVGYFEGTINLDQKGGTVNFTAEASDIFFVKYDSDMNLIWAKVLGGTSYDRVNALEVSSDGDILIGGVFVYDVDFDMGSGEHILSSPQGTTGFIAKYDKDGELIFAENPAYSVTSVLLDTAGNSYFGGELYPDRTNSSTNRYAFGKYGVNGDSLFLRSAGSGVVAELEFLGEDTVLAIVRYQDAYGSNNFQPLESSGSEWNSNSILNAPSDYGIQTVILKFSKDGDFGGVTPLFSSYEISTGGMDIDTSGNIYLCGAFDGKVDFNLKNGVEERRNGAWGVDGFVVKYNKNLEYQWVYVLDSDEGSLSVQEIAVSGEQNIVIAAYVLEDADMDPGPNVVTTNISADGNREAVIIRLDHDGKFERYDRFYGDAAEIFSGLEFIDDYRFIVTGHFRDGIVLNHQYDFESLSPVSETEGFVAVMTNCEAPNTPQVNFLSINENMPVCTNHIIELDVPDAEGQISWYDSYEGGNLVGKGSYFWFEGFSSEIDELYVQDSTCEASTRRWVGLDIFDEPYIFYDSYSEICSDHDTIDFTGLAWPEGGYFSNEIENNIFYPSENIGVNFISYFYENGNCSRANHIEINVIECITSEQEYKSSYKIFPNPTNGILTIELTKGVAEIVVTDLIGKVILKQSNSNIIDLSTLKKGKYFILITALDGYEITDRFTKL